MNPKSPSQSIIDNSDIPLTVFGIDGDLGMILDYEGDVEAIRNFNLRKASEILDASLPKYRELLVKFDAKSQALKELADKFDDGDFSNHFISKLLGDISQLYDPNQEGSDPEILKSLIKRALNIVAYDSVVVPISHTDLFEIFIEIYDLLKHENENRSYAKLSKIIQMSLRRITYDISMRNALEGILNKIETQGASEVLESLERINTPRRGWASIDYKRAMADIQKYVLYIRAFIATADDEFDYNSAISENFKIFSAEES